MTIVFQHEILRVRRKEKRLTQELLAEICGCSSRYLRDLESGEKDNPSAALVRQIAFVLEIPMETLLVLREDTENWRGGLLSALISDRFPT